MKKKRNRGLAILFIAIVVILTLFLALINFITDFLWFREMQYVSVFLTKLFTQLKIGIPSFIILGLLAFAYLMALKKGYSKRIESTVNDKDAAKKLNLAAWGLSAVFAIAATYLIISRVWFDALKFFNSQNFDIKDPLFNLDISFYLFKLEFIKQLNTIAIGLIIGFVLISVVYYMFLVSFRKPEVFEEMPPEKDDDDYDEDEDDDEEHYSGAYRGQQQNAPPGMMDIIEKIFKMLGFGNMGNFTNQQRQQGQQGQQGQQQARRAPQPTKKINDDNFAQLIAIATKQLTILGVLFFLMVGVHFFLKQFDLLYSRTGVLFGASFTDVNVTLWMYRVLIVLSLAGAVGFAIGLSKKKFRTILTVPVIMIVVGALGMGCAYLVQNFVVSPDEINKERPYLERNIQYTQYAYNLNNVDIRDFSAANNLTSADIQNNSETISNIRINDYNPVKKFYNNVQTIRPYYTFTDVDVDRYIINGEYTQTFLSAREIDDSAQSSIPATWINQHIKYTHGYGITLSRVDKITDSGQPDMLIRNIPPVSQVNEIDITNPAIYFGELTHDYVLVKTNTPEFDYPLDSSAEGGNNAETIYDGTAGIKLNLFNKTLFSIRERSLKLLVSTNLTSDSRILIYRNIMDRVRTIMPMLSYDSDPYMVTADGRLFWIVDAYTSSSYYPYSEPAPNMSINYVRNSVKIIIDAYNGTTDYYLVDHTDPIAMTYKSIYPALFKDFDQMPEYLKAHIRYPNTMLNIQANMYKRFHMSNVVTFYQNEDAWDIANEIYETTQQPMVPNYYIMKLPGEEKAEFVNSIPFTPRSKLNMTGLLVARNDVPNYGKLVLYRLPKGKIVYGPMQIEAQIDQNPEISKEFSLWSSSGSTYSRGNMFVVPIEDSLLYVEPVYLEAENSSIPEVKRVIVAYGDKIAYTPTLAGSLEYLFGKPAEEEAQGPADTGNDQGNLSTSDLINLAITAFNNAQNSQQTGDWAAYGQYLSQLQDYLTQLKPPEDTNAGI